MSMGSAVRSSKQEREMANAQFTSKDQVWAEEATIYWFTVNGNDYKSGIDFDGDVFGVRESGPDSSVVDCDGAPLDYNENTLRAIERLCVVSDEMRSA
jgi:hypothetical protein